MANAIEQLRSGLVVGHAMLGRRGQQRGSVAQQVHDGDTVTTEAAGNLGVRFWAWMPPRSACPCPAPGCRSSTWRMRAGSRY